MAKIKAFKVIQDKVSTTEVDKLVEQMSELTDENNHLEALILLASFLKNKRFINILKGIELIYEQERHMPTDLGKYVYLLRQEMVKYAEQKLGKEAGKRIYMSM